jgi:hypothetical protein
MKWSNALAARLRLAPTHKRLGQLVTIPLAGWVLSSFVLHGVGLTLPNGLQGVYELNAVDSSSVRLEDDGLLRPTDLLAQLRSDSLRRIYWLRLESLAGQPVYVVKPGPFSLERTYDALNGERLDPLQDDMLRRIGDRELRDTSVKEVRSAPEFNRYYTVAEVDAVSLEMEGAQPSELVLSRSSGRTLRRTDRLASAFDKAYKSVHVWQWGPSIRLFTAVLYALVGVTLTLVALGYVLWVSRRKTRQRWTKHVRPARRIHGYLAPFAGVILATQMLVGAYLWFNLGLIEPRFRGQGSFDVEWSGGIATDARLVAPATIAESLGEGQPSLHEPIRRYEWRAIGDRHFWIAYTARDQNGTLVDAATREVLPRLTPDLARAAGEMVVLGKAVGPAEEFTEYWMDFNARVPTYRFRFSDPDGTDVHVSQITGEVVQRRPAIWRRFGPFLTYHTFGFTGNPWVDTALLTTLQLAVLVMMISGWRLALYTPKAPRA